MTIQCSYLNDEACSNGADAGFLVAFCTGTVLVHYRRTLSILDPLYE
jgi:hypothetical protein